MNYFPSVKTGLALLLSAPLLAADTLIINSLKLEFDKESQQQVVSKESELRARLMLSYQGSGLLSGNWLLAEPGSTEGKPLYRKLQLVRENISSSQRSYLDSPELPTLRTGKYVIKFCITSINRSKRIESDPLCPSAELSAQASYQVIP